MKIRTCDKCKEKIDGSYIKCSQKDYQDNRLLYVHIADLCLKCWGNIIK